MGRSGMYPMGDTGREGQQQAKHDPNKSCLHIFTLLFVSTKIQMEHADKIIKHSEIIPKRRSKIL
jgi:hypothetical protein